MVLYGASGHAKVVLDICLRNGETISKIIDDDKSKTNFLGYKVYNRYSLEDFNNETLIISIGNNKVRKSKAAKIKVDYGIAIHPSSIIDATIDLNEGTVVMAGAVINVDSFIGKHCIINTSCSIDHDCFIDNFAHISPNATLCGGVTIGEGTQIGAGAVVLPYVKVGKWCTIGAGSVIMKDIPDGATVVGNPGRII